MAIAGADVTVRNVKVSDFAFGTAVHLDVLTLQSVSLGGDQGGTSSYQIDTAAAEELSVVVHPTLGLITRLSLTDAKGHVLMTSDGRSAADRDNLIQLYVPAGSFTLDVQDLGGAGTYTLTSALAGERSASAAFAGAVLEWHWGAPSAGCRRRRLHRRRASRLGPY